MKDIDVAVIGSGSLGTAIAQLVSNNVKEVYLYARRKKVVDEILETRFNSEYYSSIKLSDKIKPICEFDSNFDPDVLFLCVPSSSVREVSKKIKNETNYRKTTVSTAKGIEYPSLKTMSQIISEELGKDPVVFSGPTFASEIILNLPTITNIASKDSYELNMVKEVLITDNFLVETSDDIIGTEMCSIIKNINAIAYGICKGLNLNENAKCAVITKGFNEMKDIISRLGGNPKTVDKYCGFGDLVLTSTSEKSRNHTLGTLYGQRIIVDEKSSGVLFEGKKSINAIKKICEMNNIKSIVTDFVYDVLCLNEPPEIAFKKLWRCMII